MSEQENDAGYDSFARVYNRHWHSEVPPQLMTVIDRLFVPQMAEGARILDLCCGTGYMAGELSRRGFQVTGLDASAEMLAYARRNAPAASFIQADARSFQMMPIYQGIVSTFDSLNHIMTLEGLLAVFRNSMRALASGGLFLFDMNMERGFLEHWVDHFAIIENEDVCILRGTYDRERRTGRYDIIMFERKGESWNRSDTVITEKCYTAREIRRALRRAGFQDISTYDAERDMGLTDHVGRTFFLARKDS